MNILSITTQKPHSTGSGTYLTEVVRALDRQGHRQAVVAGVYHSDTVGFPEDVLFYPIYYTESGEVAAPGDIPFPIPGMSDNMPYPSALYSQLTVNEIRTLEDHFVEQVRRAIDGIHPDIILCHHLFLLTAILRKNFPDQRIYGLCHGSDLRQIHNLLTGFAGYGDSPLNAHRIISEIRKLDCIFALHQEQKDTIARIFDVPNSRIRIIGTGYNNQIFHRGEETNPTHPHRFIYAGKICREKGIPELLHALTLLSQEDVPPFELHLAGGCNDAELCRMLTGSSEKELISGTLPTFPFSIYYHGLLTQDKLADLYRSCNTFVLPSYFEGLPLVLIEAMACGLRTICNDLPGVKSWLSSEIPGYNTDFVPMPELITADQPDPEALPNYVFNLQKALRKALLKNGQKPIIPADTSAASWDSVAHRIVFG